MVEHRATSRLTERGRLVVRVALVVGAMLLLEYGRSLFERWNLIAKADFDYNNLVKWLPWLGCFVGAGVLFGLAAWLPRRLSYRPGRAVVLGILPFLAIAHFVGWLAFNLSLPGPLEFPFIMPDVSAVFTLAVLLGVAVSAGFAEPTGD